MKPEEIVKHYPAEVILSVARQLMSKQKESERAKCEKVPRRHIAAIRSLLDDLESSEDILIFPES